MEAVAAVGVVAMLVMMAMLVVLIGGAALWVWALVDVVRAPGDQAFRAGSKLLWTIVVGLGGPIGAAVYVLVGRPQPVAPGRAF